MLSVLAFGPVVADFDLVGFDLGLGSKANNDFPPDLVGLVLITAPTHQMNSRETILDYLRQHQQCESTITDRLQAQ